MTQVTESDCPRVFVSYSHQDREWKDRIVSHLEVLQLEGEFALWNDQRIAAGEDWRHEIEDALAGADVAVLLVSSAFLTSDFIRREEIPVLLKRREKEGLRIVPLVVRPCLWDAVDWLERLQVRCPKGLPESDYQVDQELTALAREIRDLLRRKPRRGPGTSELPAVLDEWFTQVVEEHRRLGDHFERPVELEELETAWVRLELALPAASASERFNDGGNRTLEDFLDLDPNVHAWVTRRWLVEGDPGSGKTTLLRHLAGRLAKGRNRLRIPVFVSLPRLVEPFRPLLAYLADEGALCGEGLPRVLDGAGRESRLFVLLDGYDEVPPERRQHVRRLLAKLIRDWPYTPVILSSRPIGLGEPPPGFHKLLLQPLADAQRQCFLENWFRHRETAAFKAVARRASVHFDSERSLRELSHNPLHLTLLTVLWEQGVKAPTRRSELYDAIFQLLLEGRHKDPPVVIPSTADVRQALRYLAYALTAEDLLAEDPERLVQRLWGDEFDTVRSRLVKVKLWGENLREFLDAVHERTYVLGPHDGPRAAWRFWHRTFREALTAERLEEIHREKGEEDLLARVETIEGDLGRWAEPFSLLAGRLGHADRFVTRLVDTNRPLGLRALATAQGLKEETLRTILGLTEKLKERQKVFESIPEQLGDPKTCLALVDRLRRSTRNGNDLFFLFGVAEEVAERWPAYARQTQRFKGRFFDHIALPEDPELFRTADVPRDGRVDLGREIPAGEGWVGSPNSETNGHSDEGPCHRVTIVRPFQLAAVPVTNAQFAAFDPNRADVERPHYPVVDVTWYEAVSFCRWLAARVPGCSGARLPTEEEWEYACRAGTETCYWNGDSEEALADVGWYIGNSTYHVQRSGKKRANPWGLYDMHGNVWEWTASTYKTYSGREDGFKVDLDGEPPDLAASSSAEMRVVRGGSFWNPARGVRSAARSYWGPGVKFGYLSFRVVTSPSPSQLGL